MLVTRWLESRSYHEAAKTVEAEISGVRRTVNEVSVEVERALLGELLVLVAGREHMEPSELTCLPDGDYGALEGLLGKEGIMKPQAQKSFLYLCYRQQFLEFIENRQSRPVPLKLAAQETISKP